MIPLAASVLYLRDLCICLLEEWEEKEDEKDEDEAGKLDVETRLGKRRRKKRRRRRGEEEEEEEEETEGERREKYDKH